MFELSSFPSSTGEKPQKPLELCPLKLCISNFTTKFDELIDDLGRIQKENIPAYQKLLDHLDDNRKTSIRAIVTQNERSWRRIMYNKKLTPNEKVGLFNELNATISTATAEICDLIKAKQNYAREMADQLDNSELIASITTLLQNAIDAQEQAAIQLVKIADTLSDELNLRYTKPEHVLMKIDAKLKAKY